MSIEENIESARLVAVEQSKPGKFSLLERLEGRSYPTEDVEVYLDEAAGHEIEKLNAALATETDADKVAALERQIGELSEVAKASKLTFHLQGIPSDVYDSVITDAQTEFPVEYREERNPITLKMEREPIENEDRDTYFRVHLWAKYIRKITDAQGNVDTDITPELIRRAQDLLPLAAVGRIHVAIENLRMITNWMDQIQGSDFLVKS